MGLSRETLRHDIFALPEYLIEKQLQNRMSVEKDFLKSHLQFIPDF